MLSTKIPTTIIAAVALAAISLPASASAMATAQKAGTVTKPVAVVAASVTTALRGAPKEAGSAGVPGYGDDTCQGLANDYVTAVTELESAVLEGDAHGEQIWGQQVTQIHRELSDNCLLVD